MLNQNGQATSLPATDPSGPGTDNWEVEEALDVEWAHAIAPGAQIVLVEANSQSLSDLMTGGGHGRQPARRVGGVDELGLPRRPVGLRRDEANYDSTFNVPGVTFVASTGDYGAADPEYPAFSPNVVAVGGTSLTLNADNSYNSETGWGYYSDAAGDLHRLGRRPQPVRARAGLSSKASSPRAAGPLPTSPSSPIRRPGPGSPTRTTCHRSNPFEVVGGTSLSAPAWAGLMALVNQGRAAAGESPLNSDQPDRDPASPLQPAAERLQRRSPAAPTATPPAPATTW